MSVIHVEVPVTVDTYIDPAIIKRLFDAFGIDVPDDISAWFQEHREAIVSTASEVIAGLIAEYSVRDAVLHATQDAVIEEMI